MSTPQPARGRTRTIALAAAAAVAAVVVAILVAQGGDDGDGAAAPTSRPSASAEPSPTPSDPSPTPDEATEAPAAEPPAPDAEPGEEAQAPAEEGPAPLATLPPVTDDPPQVVPLDGVAEVGRTATARVLSVEDVTATGTGIGEISGPALLATVEVTNTGSQELDLGTFSVDAYLGEAGVPASPVTSDERNAPLTGALAPGATARGVYVFSAPPDQRGVLSLTVLAGLDTRLVVFQGDPASRGG